MTKTILIAVNDPNILYLLQRYAEESGFGAVTAPLCSDVLALLLQGAAPALIILEADSAGTADLDARKVWQAIRAEAAARRTPVLLYSCLDDPTEERWEGAAGFLPKSVMYDDFVAALRRAGVPLGPALSQRGTHGRYRAND